MLINNSDGSVKIECADNVKELNVYFDGDKVKSVIVKMG